MTTNHRKYKYTGSAGDRPNASSDRNVSKARSESAPPSPNPSEMDTSGLMSGILLALKSDISVVIKSELKDALAEDFDFLKSELRAVKSENSTAALRSELDQVKASVNDIEGGFSNWSNEVVALQSTVGELKSELKELKVKCEDLKGRMRRCNVRILGVPETPRIPAYL
ncbi:uncharacterized protein LOC124626348 [Tachysurus ichikawai]